MADNSMNAFLDTQETREEPKRKRRKKGAGEVVHITLRLTHAQWRMVHDFALSEGLSINELAILGVSELLKQRGLPEL